MKPDPIAHRTREAAKSGMPKEIEYPTPGSDEGEVQLQINRLMPDDVVDRAGPTRMDLMGLTEDMGRAVAALREEGMQRLTGQPKDPLGPSPYVDEIRFTEAGQHVHAFVGPSKPSLSGPARSEEYFWTVTTGGVSVRGPNWNWAESAEEAEECIRNWLPAHPQMRPRPPR